jgi:hypothetical protein
LVFFKTSLVLSNATAIADEADKSGDEIPVKDYEGNAKRG